MAVLHLSAHLLALAVIAIAGSPAHAAIFDSDDRVAVPRQAGRPYAPIGRVIADGRAGTGFLVGACHVLTVEHIFSDPSALGRPINFYAVHARFGRAPPASRGTVVASGKFDAAHQAGDWSEGRSKDWMLIHLDICLGSSLGFVDLAADQVFRFDRADAPVRSAGFPSDRRSVGSVVLDPSCRIRAATFREFLHDCATLPGSSGSPIFQEFRSGGRVRLRVVAMVTCGEHEGDPRAYHNATANRATKIAYILPHIAAILHATTASDQRMH